MGQHLHIFIVSTNPERCTAFEYCVDRAGRGLFAIERITWGTDREHNVPSLIEILMRRRWSSTAIDKALTEARLGAIDDMNVVKAE